VIGLPPSAGAVHDTVAEESAGEAVTPVGGPGTVAAGVTGFDRADAGPAPTPLAAETLKV
jgi:hypothetical protein